MAEEEDNEDARRDSEAAAEADNLCADVPNLYGIDVPNLYGRGVRFRFRG